MALIRNDIPHRRRPDLERLISCPIESMFIECIIKKEKWMFTCFYSPHNKFKSNCCDAIDTAMNAINSENIHTYFVLGDMNINALCKHDRRTMYDLLDIYDMTNIITSPTCYKSAENPTLLDVILTGSSRRISDTLNVNTGISDFHHLVGFSTKLQIPRSDKSIISYRSYKHFDELSFKNDMQTIPYHVGEVFDDIDDSYWFTQKLISSVIDKHAPMKRRKAIKTPVPFMNSQLRKSCHRKAMLHNRYFKNDRQKKDWELFRRIRNSTTKLKAKSMKKYFDSKCNKVHKHKPQLFWNTVKPFICDKGLQKNECRMLNINGTICNDAETIAQEFNDYFCNTVTNMSDDEQSIRDGECVKDIYDDFEYHESILSIKSRNYPIDAFSFEEVNEDVILKLVRSLDGNKATGHDNIPAALLKSAAEELALLIKILINRSIRDAQFPHDLKLSEIPSIFKSKDDLDKENFRPISILPCISKIFENVYYEQLYNLFCGILSSSLAAYRRNYGCQHVLTKLIQDCKSALDKGEFVGMILMDLSKAFDCLPHRLLLCKLRYYGISDDACTLLMSYLSQRKQRVKIGRSRSYWGNLSHGVPHIGATDF